MVKPISLIKSGHVKEVKAIVKKAKGQKINGCLIILKDGKFILNGYDLSGLRKISLDLSITVQLK